MFVGFVGHQCHINVDECDSDPCKHNAKCVDLINAYQCECATGWDGHHCQNNIMCVEDPCENGGTTLSAPFLCLFLLTSLFTANTLYIFKVVMLIHE